MKKQFIPHHLQALSFLYSSQGVAFFGLFREETLFPQSEPFQFFIKEADRIAS